MPRRKVKLSTEAAVMRESLRLTNVGNTIRKRVYASRVMTKWRHEHDLLKRVLVVTR